MASWTSPEDVTGAWIGEGAPTDLTLVQTWIDRAERMIRRRVPDVQARIDDEAEIVPPTTELIDTVKDVVVSMVTRIFRNPEGVRQRNSTETTGPFSQTTSTTLGGDDPGTLYMTDDELAAVQGIRASGAFTVDMIPTTSPFSPHYVTDGVW